MQRQFEDTIEKYNMLPDDCGVIVAVSGGADSVALLSLFSECSKVTRDRLLVVHVEHGIRGEDSYRDAEYVEQFCSKLGISCHIHHIKVMEEVKKTGETVEEAARRIRYDILKNEAADLEKKQNCAVKIAVAHHLYDQAETVIMNLVRGAHLKGLGGMQPINGRIIRPLLYCKRDDIEAYLKNREIKWCTDVTNDDTVYTRNLIRHEVLPLLEKINTRALEHIVDTADELRKIEKYLESETEELYKKYISGNEYRILLSRNIYSEIDESNIELLNRVIYKAISKMAGKAKDITGTHVDSVRNLNNKQVGKSVNLPYQLKAIRDYEGIVFCKTTESEKVDSEVESDYHYEMDIIDIDDNFEIEKKEYTKYFDYDIIGSAVIRKPMERDFLVIDDEGHSKSLHKYLKDEKVSQLDRNNVDILADGNHVMWVVGHRISEAYKVTSSTKRVLRVRRI